MSRAAVRTLARGERLLDRERIEAARRERRGIEIDRHLARPAADDRDLGDVGQLLERLLQLPGHLAQPQVVVARRPTA